MRRLLLAATTIALAALYARALTGVGGASLEPLFTDWLYLGLEFGGVGLCASRALLVRDHRVAWACIAIGFASWTAGDVAWVVLPASGDSPVTDGLYLAFYPFCCAGVALLAAQGRERVAARIWIDGLLAALTVAAMIVALAFDPIVAATHGDAGQIGANVASAIGDLVLIGFVLTAFATQAWRPGRGWALFGIGAILIAVADTIYVYQDAVGSYRDGSLVGVMWPTAVLCCSWSAWQAWLPKRPGAGYGRLTLAYPGASAVIALALLAYDHFVPLSDASALLATAALAVALVRAGITFNENTTLLRATREDALTDGLTGLPNRRRLMQDLERAFGGRGAREQIGRATFAFFDLDGFKAYNDSYGHAAGDMLLGRLARQLADAVAGRGSAYRIGGDEFCVLLDGRHAAHDSVMTGCRHALEEHGAGFRVGSSHGVVAIPDEAEDPTQALQLADRRMYADKARKRTSSRTQTRDVLLQVLREREPDLHRHLHGVAALATAVGQRMGLSAEQLDEVGRAAELHDVGKIAIPDEILHRPGPLSSDEWRLMRQHTVIGDRILGAAPAMRPVAKIVRASHERFDGEGYPDRLAGTEIPLGARIVSVCDAFHAMTSDRPYQRSLDREAALAELQRCAGTQFDPAVVDAFCAVAASDAPPSAGGDSPAIGGERPHAHDRG